MDDKDIINLYNLRNEEAIAETQKKYGSYCLSIANNILCNNESAEECINDTYLKTWNSIPPKHPNSLRLFLAKITRNIAFDENGNFDPRLFESTDGFSHATGWYKEELQEEITEEIGTLEDTEMRFRNKPEAGYMHNDFFIRTFSDFSQESQTALEYVKNTDNGLYVPEFKAYSTSYIREEEKVKFIRYIDGIATNETITIYPNKMECSSASFDEAELSPLPLIRSAFLKICEEFEAGKVTPPHIEGFEEMKNTVNGIYP